MTTFGKRLKEARTHRQLTQNEVAGKLGIDFTTISKYENNKSQPDNEILRELASMYEVSLDWLITGQLSGDEKSSNKILVNGVLEPLTEEEARHLLDSLEMFRLLKAKRNKDKDKEK
ncbi:helix-turn-helix domain-containing protein [Cohnella silvisoli]|uniref:Helix-turn-helix transcriptional regulator n=1 Tax=Cohnella silvisoli TaxID=2873699 RepID=A0ABV1KY38_9BACL|nr:helix-turn-helix transcriptional regulator [Cohnella silvisoli]MCD9024096.1 helix-turn-helix domain-containing protein [Cohnella silvisoli]